MTDKYWLINFLKLDQISFLTLSISLTVLFISEKEDPSQKSTAIRTRRKRESRRPTGKIALEDIPVSQLICVTPMVTFGEL